MAPDDSVAGFCLTYPDYGPLITQGAKATRVALKDLAFDTHFELLAAHPPRMIILKTFATAIEHRRKGILNAMASRALNLAAGHYDAACGAIMRGDNPTRAFARDLHHHERTYGLYMKKLREG